ncbi:MAG: PD-(D/E)XK nuclease family protein, partial [Desulfobulbaceae bacterium]|nr:PD-(D/E)XK nuclease family protein [Desulfobulbaceae bacterium]
MSKIFSNKTVDKKGLQKISSFFSDLCRPVDKTEACAKKAIIDAVNSFVDEELCFIYSRETDIVLRKLKKYVSAIYTNSEEKAGSIKIMPLANVFGKQVNDLYVTGLSAKIFPRTAPQNPLFLDAEIKKINNLAGNPVISSSVSLTEDNLYECEKLLFSSSKKFNVSYVYYDEKRIISPSDFMMEHGDKKNRLADSLEDYLENIGASADLRQISQDNTARFPINPLAAKAAYASSPVFASLDTSFKTINKVMHNRFFDDSLTIYDGMVKERGRFDWINDLNTVFSASSLKNLLQCPFRFFLNKILYLDSPSFPEDWDGVTWLNAMDRGSLYHEILDLYFSRLRKKEFKTDKKKSDLLRMTAEELIKEYKQNLQPDKKIYQHEKSEIMSTLKIILAKENNINQYTDYENIMTEASFGLKAKVRRADILSSGAIKTSLSKNQDIKLHGYIDRIDIDRKRKKARLIDYKTGKNRLDMDSPRDWDNQAENIQHVVYGMVFEKFLKKYKVNELETGYYFISEKGGFTLAITDFFSVVKDFKKAADSVLKTTKKERAFFLNPDNCEYCDFTTICMGNTFL